MIFIGLNEIEDFSPIFILISDGNWAQGLPFVDNVQVSVLFLSDYVLKESSNQSINSLVEHLPSYGLPKWLSDKESVC